ncbi:MAG: hypothetical protein DMF74_19340 [Acidobacteria bacterium]|nr:MAG: hypothetical protein DMF74_19340 [Acidobacteriota bacterium]
MKRTSFSYLLIPVLLAISSCARIHAQPQYQREENRYVVEPPDVVFLLIASQPGSPIGFKDMKLLARIDNRRTAVSGKIYNAGTKPIRYVSLMLVGYSGAVSTLRGSGPMSGAVRTELLMPGEEIQDEDPAEIVPLTEELKEKLNLRGGRAKAFFVLMVNSVTFGDGTKYTDEKTITSVRTYLEALGEKIENFECSTKRRPDH